MVDNSNLGFKGNEDADAGDIIVPRILLMQGTSKWVPETFNMGEIIDSVEEKVLAAKGKSIKIIPFVMRKSWEVFIAEQPPTWVRSEPWNAGNDADEWKFTEDDPARGEINYFRQRNYGFYCFVLEEDGAIDEFAIPALINFRSSSGFKEGKKIASWFSRMKSMNQPGFTVSWEISSETVKTDDKSYQKFVVKRGANVSKEQMEPIYKWLTLFSDQAERIKDHDAEEVAEQTTPSGGSVSQENAAQF